MCNVCISRRWFCALLPAAVAGTPANAAAWIEPRFHRVPSRSGERRVALTLDACPGSFDARIARVLVEQRAKATIFLTERWMRLNQDGLAFFLDNRELFAFENHGARHVPPILG